VYGTRIGLSLLLLLLLASSGMAHTEFKAKLAGEPPVDNNGQPMENFDHYRLYICSQPIVKHDDQVACHGGELITKDVEKDKQEAEVVYMLPTLEDKIYFRAATRTQENVESDLSEQVVIEPYRMVSLANSYFLMNASEGFDDKHALEHLWDRCVENVPECTASA
jgi:hypothetical protein